jgi:uncharacterized membrane protein YeaQ/YmgE (transglycosylase-associated protein family)
MPRYEGDLVFAAARTPPGSCGKTSLRTVRITRYLERLMSIVAWIIMGLVAGLIARGMLNGMNQGLPADLLLGIVGAVGAGWVFNGLTTTTVTEFNLYSVLVAFVGAAALILACRRAFRDTRYRRHGVS